MQRILSAFYDCSFARLWMLTHLQEIDPYADQVGAAKQ
jgi:hypothetical protein